MPRTKTPDSPEAVLEQMLATSEGRVQVENWMKTGHSLDDLVLPSGHHQNKRALPARIARAAERTATPNRVGT